MECTVIKFDHIDTVDNPDEIVLWKRIEDPIELGDALFRFVDKHVQPKYGLPKIEVHIPARLVLLAGGETGRGTITYEDRDNTPTEEPETDDRDAE